MSTAPVVQESDPILGTDFIREMVRQMRALDTYGVYNGQSPEKILDPFVLTRARRQEIPLVGDPDAALGRRLSEPVFAQALEIRERGAYYFHPDVGASIDALLQGQAPPGRWLA